MLQRALAVCAVVGSSVLSFAQSKPHVLMISIDGMKPEYVTKAEEHGLKIPTLRSFLTNGTYAEGVQGVLPTVTYPSHTTLVTGVSPEEHGVTNNTTFDPMDEHPGEWYWYFHVLKVPTLYQAADQAGLTTGAVSWPVTVGAPIDYLIAEYAQSEDTDTPQGARVHPADIKKQLGVSIPDDPNRENSVVNDERITAWSVAMIQHYHPNLMLVHVANLDHQEHMHSPFSPQANAALEVLDGQVAKIIAAEHAVDPQAKIVIVSDHGFVPVEHHVNLNAFFVQEGLITLKQGKLPKHTPRVTSWEASAWNAGGTSFIMLRDPKDAATVAKVKGILAKLQSDPQYGVARILTAKEAHAIGGAKDASFVVAFKPGYAMANAFKGDIVTDAPGTGTHGYLPEFPELRSSFMAEGPGIAKGRDLQVIDMRQIAPTVAKMLGIQLPTAKMAPVNYKP